MILALFVVTSEKLNCPGQKKVKRKKLLKIKGRHFLFSVNEEEKEMDPPRKSI